MEDAQRLNKLTKLYDSIIFVVKQGENLWKQEKKQRLISLIYIKERMGVNWHYLIWHIYVNPSSIARN